MKRQLHKKTISILEIMATLTYCQRGCQFLNETHIITTCGLFPLRKFKSSVGGFLLRHKECILAER